MYEHINKETKEIEGKKTGRDANLENEIRESLLINVFVKKTNYSYIGASVKAYSRISQNWTKLAANWSSDRTK